MLCRGRSGDLESRCVLSALRSDDFFRVGDDIANAGLPTAFIFEGGYAVAELGVNAVNVLEGFAQRGG